MHRDPDLLSRLLDQHQARGWPELFSTLVEVMGTSLPPDEAHRLMTGTGMMLSETLNLPQQLSMEDAEEQLNALLAAKAWGFIKFVSDQDDLVIQHAGFPALMASHSGESVALICALLGGLHYGLFTAIGLNPDAEVTVEINHENALIAEVRFGL